MPVIGILIVIFVFVVSVYWAGGTMDMFFNIPSFLIVFGVSFSALVAGGRLGDFVKGARIWLTRSDDVPPSEAKKGRDAFDLAFRAANGSAIVGFSLGAVIAFVNLQELPKVGPPLAMACISAMLGLTLSYLVILPARSFLEKLIAQNKGE